MIIPVDISRVKDEVLVTNLNAQRAEYVKRIEEIDALLTEIKTLSP